MYVYDVIWYGMRWPAKIRPGLLNLYIYTYVHIMCIYIIYAAYHLDMCVYNSMLQINVVVKQHNVM